jgi:hypothetical protein
VKSATKTGGAGDERRLEIPYCLLPTAYCLICVAISDGDSPMAKGQMKSNKEKRKPKKDKDDKKAAKK